MVNILAINDIEDILCIYKWCRERNILPEVADYIPTGRTKGGVLQETLAIREHSQLTASEKADYLQRLQPLSHAQKMELEQRAREIDQTFGIERDPKTPRAYFCGTPCTQIFGVLVNRYGTVYPCVAESLRLGNIKKTTLSELWEEMSMQDLRSSAN